MMLRIEEKKSQDSFHSFQVTLLTQINQRHGGLTCCYLPSTALVILKTFTSTLDKSFVVHMLLLLTGFLSLGNSTSLQNFDIIFYSHHHHDCFRCHHEIDLKLTEVRC